MGDLRITCDPVEFDGFDGTTLRGDFYRPVGDVLLPGVVMSHGFGAVRTMALPAYADVLARGGIAVLLYDHRNLGDSDGEPRQEINPWAQSRDMQCALGWLGRHPDVDDTRLGLWGSSFSGGEALVVAAIDERVRAVAANVPFGGLGVDGYDETEERVRAIAQNFAAGVPSLADPGGDVVGPLSIVPDPASELPSFLDQPESSDWYLDAGGRSATWRNQVTLRNAFGTEPAFDPAVAAAHLDGTPLLMVVATEDRVADVDVARASFDRATEPKQLVTIAGHHFAPYAGDELTIAATAARDFFLERLRPNPRG